MIPPAVAAASSDVLKFLITCYRNERGVHAETIIGAAAALAGESALRAAEPELPESGWVVSEKTSGLLFGDHSKGQVGLWDILREGAAKAGADASDLPDPAEVTARTAKAVGGSPFPPISVPEKHYPHEWSPNACPRLRDGIEQIFADHGLEGADMAKAVVLAIVLLINQTKGVLPPGIAAALALEVMVGVTHMAPLREPV